MNKIFNDNIKIVCENYVDFVEPKVRHRLNIVVGIISVKGGLLQNNLLNNDSFSLGGINYEIGSDPFQKKEFVNMFLDDSKGCTIEKGTIDFSNLTDISNYKTDLNKTFPVLKDYTYLSSNLKDLLAQELSSIVNTQLPYLEKEFKNIGKEEKKLINAIFLYSDFFQNPGSEWYYGLKLAQALKVEICPYCNRTDIQSTFDVNGKKLSGPTIDHFLGQAEYPFLTLSFYNLIPSCYDCNSQLKHDKPFNLTHFLYPYTDSYEDMACFQIYQDKSLVSGKLIGDDDLEIVVTDLIKDDNANYLKLHGTIPKGLDRKKGSLNVFQTVAIYNQKNLKNAKILIDKHRKFSKEHVDSLFESMLKDQGLSKSDAYLTYYEAEPYEKDFNNMPLSRFKRDLNLQLNKIYDFNHL